MSTSLVAPREAAPTTNTARVDDSVHLVNETFSPRVRRIGVLYVCVTLPLVALAGTMVHGQTSYIRAWVYLASGIYTTPALVVTWLTLRRVDQGNRGRWTMWFLGLILTYTTGLGMLAGLATHSGKANSTGAPVVALVVLLFVAVLIGLVRSCSGRRALSVDLAEWAMSLVALAAPAALLWGDDIVSSDHDWWTVPAALATLGALSGFYWVTVLYMRLRPERTVQELTVLRIGIALAVIGVVDGAAQVAQGLSDFTLPSPPLVALQAGCMSGLLLVPLFLPVQLSPGYHRLPPQAQVRGAGLAPVMTLVSLPVLLVATLAVRDQHRWATAFSLAVVALLLVIAVLRHLAAVHETRALYALVEKASDERRDLLAKVIQRMNDDRHAVAAQLHEQAMSAYATFVSFMTSRSPVDHGSPTAMASASNLLRDDLARQAESLRQLMLAIRPMAMERSRSESLRAPIQAYVDSLYGDNPAPRLDVSVDDNLMLDWITETIVSRIVQEALRNVWRHSSATYVTVSIQAAGDLVEVRVQDDGLGFDPDTNLFESGIAAMRSFAAFGNGTLEVESAPGGGTTVLARLGEEPPARPEPAPKVPHLRLVRSEDHETAGA
jgi:signal transduction histidine kinase